MVANVFGRVVTLFTEVMTGETAAESIGEIEHWVDKSEEERDESEHVTG